METFCGTYATKLINAMMYLVHMHWIRFMCYSVCILYMTNTCNFEHGSQISTLNAYTLINLHIIYLILFIYADRVGTKLLRLLQSKSKSVGGSSVDSSYVIYVQFQSTRLSFFYKLYLYKKFVTVQDLFIEILKIYTI